MQAAVPGAPSEHLWGHSYFGIGGCWSAPTPCGHVPPQHREWDHTSRDDSVALKIHTHSSSSECFATESCWPFKLEEIKWRQTHQALNNNEPSKQKIFGSLQCCLKTWTRSVWNCAARQQPNSLASTRERPCLFNLHVNRDAQELFLHNLESPLPFAAPQLSVEY